MDVNLQDYLLKNDSKWMYDHYSPKKKRTSDGAVIDWGKKDEAVFQKVKVDVDDIIE